MAHAHDTASTVGAEDGDVHVDGPNGVTYSMTPAAAEETSHRLLACAAEAQGQRIEQRRQDDARSRKPDSV